MFGVQGALSSNPSDSLSRLEKSLREQYLNILNLEEDFWALKSRVGWVGGWLMGIEILSFFTLSLLPVEDIIRLIQSIIVWGIESLILSLLVNIFRMGFLICLPLLMFRPWMEFASLSGLLEFQMLRL